MPSPKASTAAEAVATFTHGDRYDNYLRVVRLGLNARNGDAEAVADYILANAPTERNGKCYVL